LIRFSISLVLIGLVSCKTSVIAEFPNVEAELFYSVAIRGEKCFARCYDIREATSIDPVFCGLPEGTVLGDDMSWEVHYLACDDISGFKNRAWSLRVEPYFEEVSDWVYDNLGLIQEKINKLMKKED